MSDLVRLDQTFSDAVKTKGYDYVQSGAVTQHNDRVWKVQGSRPKPYVVNADLRAEPDGGVTWDWAMCSCPHGKNATGVPSCSHFFAALVYVLLDARGMID